MRLWLALAVFLVARPAYGQTTPHPTLQTAIPLARAAAAARDYRVYLNIGLGVHNAPGLTCADPRARYRLGQRGWNEIPDTSGPPHTDASPEAAELFNRTLGTDKGFQTATGCRPLNRCETSFGPTNPENGFRGDRRRAFRLDRQCLDHPGQLIEAVRGGRLADVELLLRGAPKAWRKTDARGRDIYDWALIEAAKRGRRDVLDRLLTKVPTGRVPVDVPERSIEAAMLAALTPPGTRDSESALALARRLHSKGARLAFRRQVNVSLLTEFLGESSSRQPGRLQIVDWLLAAGADPNGPPCGTLPGGARVRGYEPLQWALEDEPVFDRLVAAGARVANSPCKTDDHMGGMTLTYRAMKGLEHLGPGFEERRRIAIKLLRMGGRVTVWGQDPVSVSGSNLEALSILVAAAELDGVRDRFLRAVIAGSAGRSDGAPAVRQARVWLACPHAAPTFLADRALLCAGAK